MGIITRADENIIYVLNSQMTIYCCATENVSMWLSRAE